MVSKPVKVGDCYKLILNSKDATQMADNTFKFDVNMKDLEGDVIRCALKKVVYPPPATYTPRRLWFAYASPNGNTWFPSSTVGQVNDYNTLYAKYGINNKMYFYVPSTNTYARLYWTNLANATIRGCWISSSIDGVNWTADGNEANNGIPGSNSGNVPCDLYEIDITTQPMGTRLQNIHCPQLKTSRSYDSTTRENTNIIGNIGNNQNFNQYVQNDITYKVKDDDCANEVSGSMLRGLTSLDIYFSRVATPTVKETVALPWSIELVLYA